MDKTMDLSELFDIDETMLPIFYRLEYGDVVIQISITDLKKPLVYTFDDLRSAGCTKERDGWGFQFTLKQELNVISILEYSKSNWYRSPEMLELIQKLSCWPLLKKFRRRVSYGTSMGGYAASAFADILLVDTCLLLSPISSLNKNHCGWDTRYTNGAEMNWSGVFHDGAKVLSAQCVVVYDPTFHLDKLHADRFRNLSKNPYMLPVCGLEHSSSKYLTEIGLLKNLFLDVVYDRKIDRRAFLESVKEKRRLDKYYYNLLSVLKGTSTYKRRIIVGAFINELLRTSTSHISALERVGRVLYSLKEFELLRALTKFSVANLPDNTFFKMRNQEFNKV
jgi:hypothetical protein